MAQYNNPVVIASGRKLVTQQPMDDRFYYNTIAEVAADIAAGAFVSWYKYMPVYIAELAQWSIWLDIAEASVISYLQDAQITQSIAIYSDPAFIGTIYENKAFQLYRTVAIPLPHTHVEADISNLDKYSKAQVNQLLTTKQNTLPANTTGGIATLFNDNGSIFWAILNILTNPVDGKYNVRVANAWLSIFDPGFTPLMDQPVGGIAKLPDTLVLPGAAYVLVNPVNLPNRYTCYIIHDGVSANSLELSGYPIDGVGYVPVTPFIIPQYKSALLGVINGQWRTL